MKPRLLSGSLLSAFLREEERRSIAKLMYGPPMEMLVYGHPYQSASLNGFAERHKLYPMYVMKSYTALPSAHACVSSSECLRQPAWEMRLLFPGLHTHTHCSGALVDAVHAEPTYASATFVHAERKLYCIYRPCGFSINIRLFLRRIGDYIAGASCSSDFT